MFNVILVLHIGNTVIDMRRKVNRLFFCHKNIIIFIFYSYFYYLPISLLLADRY